MTTQTETPTPAERERWQRLADDVAGMPLTAKEPMLAAAIPALLSALARAERERDEARQAALERAAAVDGLLDVEGRLRERASDRQQEILRLANIVCVREEESAALRSERDALAAEVASVRQMFDVTRHRACDRLGLERSASWSAVEDRLVAAGAERVALVARAEGLAEKWASGWGSQQTSLAQLSVEHAEELRAALATPSEPRNDTGDRR
jgi:hypothetical protein